jgi:hypothetical protein
MACYRVNSMKLEVLRSRVFYWGNEWLTALQEGLLHEVSYTRIVKTDANVSIYLVLKIRCSSARASCNHLWIRGLSTHMSPFYTVFFLSCKANARVKLAKTGHSPHSPIVVLFYVLIDLYRSMYCLCVNVYYCHRVTTQLQLTNISYIV